MSCEISFSSMVKRLTILPVSGECIYDQVGDSEFNVSNQVTHSEP